MSLKEEDWVERAGEMLKKAEEKGVKILLPIDNRVADHFGEDAVPEVVASDAIPDDREGMDIGPETEKLYADAVKAAKTVFWNGPMGVFEFDNFAHGTRHRGRRPRHRGLRLHLDHRRRRLRRGHQQVWPGRQDELDLHRRWRLQMNKTYSEGVVLAQGLADELKDGTGDVDVVVCPPAVDLKGVSEVIEQTSAPFALGAQNVYWEESGAYTGETAPNMLEAVGATYCIIGHSERRDYFGETDEDVNKKAKALMAHGIVPISCCGESLEIREAGTHVEFVVDQRPLQVRDRLRAHLGHRHRQDRHGRRRPGGLRRHSRDPHRDFWRGDRPGHSRPLRRLRQAREHCRLPREGGR